MGSGRGRTGGAGRGLQGEARAQNSRRQKRRSFPRNPRLPPRSRVGGPARFFDRGKTRWYRTKVRLGTRPALGRNHQQHQQTDRRGWPASRQCAGSDPHPPSLGRGRFLCRRTRARQKRSPKSPRLRRSGAGHGRGKLKMATATVTKKARNQTAGKLPPKTATAGRFGVYGGRYVPETLMAALDELEREYEKAKRDRKFQQRLDLLLKTYAGRPTPLFFARRLSKELGGAKIYLKREDLLHTGAHKINNCLGQGLLVERMGKRRVIAETGAGQHGVATATVCALLGFECVVYMGTEDMRRQELNVFRMRLLGAEVRGVESGSRTLKDAINEAMRDWVTNVRNTHYLLGSVLGAHPYPTMVRDFQSVIGREARQQILAAEKRLPTHLIACVGGGSNSIGLFYNFLRDADVKMLGIEAGGRGGELGEHAARLAAHQGFTGARPGVLQGTYTYVLQNEDGQIATTHSISAGLDYPAIGPEHAWLADQHRAEYAAVDDQAALDAAKLLSRTEGIIPALESAHALAGLIQRLSQFKSSDLVILNLSGRGDKDMDTYKRLL